MTDSNLMTTAQAADALGCTRRTIARWVEDGRITAKAKLPGETGAYLFEPAEVERVANEIAQALKDELQRLESRTGT